MRDRRAIIIKHLKLQKIRNNLRDVLIQASNVQKEKAYEKERNLLFKNDGTRRTIYDLSPSELKRFRTLQQEQNTLSDLTDRSICKCVACGKADRDMVYNKAYYAWYCTECYEMHREYAKLLFQVIGKTKPEGHEEIAIHELYETFIDYEESHEIELKLVREGILIYLLKFHDPIDDLSYATFMEILERTQKPIVHVLNALKDEKLIDLEGSSDKFKVLLTQQGKIEAEILVSKVKGKDDLVPTYEDYMFNSLENFKHLIGTQSFLYEYSYPEMFEKIANNLKSTKTKASCEKIKRRLDKFKENLGYFYRS